MTTTPILDTLVRMRDYGPVDRTVGICYNMRSVIGANTWLRGKAKRYIREGRTKSKDHVFPVAGEAAYVRQYREYKLWTSRLRLKYLQWLIDQARQDGV